MNPLDEFEQAKKANIARQGADSELRATTRQWFDQSAKHRYTYNFTWLGVPVIQVPQDIVALQEVLWKVRPSLVIETGIAHGGSLILSASILELLGGDGVVVGVDIDIRAHNRAVIDAHPMRKRIELIEGPSTAPETVEKVLSYAKGRGPVVVILDSNHTHEHVLAELHAYSGLVTPGSYLIVFDTVVEDMAEDAFVDRPWGRGNNPKTAVREFLKGTSRFQVDRELEDKLLITVAPEGYLRCVS